MTPMRSTGRPGVAEIHRRRRSFPLFPRARPAEDGVVLLPRTDRRRRRRSKARVATTVWIAGAILVGGLTAIALLDDGWVEALVDGQEGVESPQAPARPLGPGNLGLPPPDEGPAPPP